MDERKEPYIEQQSDEDALYTQLQQQTLNEVQRLSGKIWTDYNVHDPGVTTADAVNHALTELSYKLGFPLSGYLTQNDGTLSPGRYGLCATGEMLPAAPVTAEDYRQLLMENIPELDSVSVSCDPQNGGYTFRVTVSPFEQEQNEPILKNVEAEYNRHRNLCEYLRHIEIVQPEELTFQADFEIGTGEDASIVLARIYHVILRHLSGKEGNGTEYVLYKALCRVQGVRSFSTCYLMKTKMEDGKEGYEPLTDFSAGFSLKIPKDEKDLENVRIRLGKEIVKADIERFNAMLKRHYYLDKRNRKQKSEVTQENISGIYHDVFTHTPIASDFPLCYRLSPDRQIPTSFEAYLNLYDRIIRRGLQEVKELPSLLSLEAEDCGDLTIRRVRSLKKHYLDFLDKLYGVESHPDWLSEQNSYGETEEGTLRRRMKFLSAAAYLTGNRFRARNVTISGMDDNAPVIKEWFCLLLGIDHSDGHTVSNVLSRYNLRIVEHRKDKLLADRIDSLLIDERKLDADHVERVKYEELAAEESAKQEEFKQMMAELRFFNVNRISGDLFRGGVNLENYRTVKVSKDEYMLIYHNQEREGWTNLGCSTDWKRLHTLANILRRFLRELNRDCETLYIMESVLVNEKRPFHLMMMLPAWTARFHQSRFREKCRELLRTLVPAHLSGTICWLGENDMRRFEGCYHQLMRAFTDSRLVDYKKMLLEAIDELTANVEKQELDDTD